jgi:hypothetical protein
MNRHDIYIWEASAADLSKDFNELKVGVIMPR